LPRRNARDLARVLLEKAAEDEFVFDSLAPMAGAPDASLGFHAQQAAEKLLKGVLASKGVAYERTHDLRYLSELAVDAGLVLPVEIDALDGLTVYAVALRYDNPLAAEPLDRDVAADLVHRLRAWANRFVEG
jgi:HEPN domain-containing protein